jgi:ABC-type transport system involved in multi-copper enzyme maturation permease subunit
MRSLGGTLMSFGTIALAFGAVTLILFVLAKVNSHPGLAEMTRLGVSSVVVGAALLVVGYFLSRTGRREDSRSVESTR